MFTPSAPITIPPMVSVFTKGIGWVGEDASTAAPVSASAPSTTGAWYPIVLPASCVVKRLWWANGATTTGGATIEVGIYADSGSFSPSAKLVSGSATQGNANEVQFVDVGDVSLAPGLYWIAMVTSTATNTTLFSASVASGAYDAPFSFRQSSAYPLPATATPIESTAASTFLCGFSTTASP